MQVLPNRTSTWNGKKAGFMLIPTADFDPMFAHDGVPFRVKMADYIRREFSDLLGRHAALLHRDGGLERLAQMYSQPSAPADREKRAA